MAENDNPKLLKEVLNAQAMQALARAAKNAAPGFDVSKFLELALAKLDDLSVMERMAQAADALRACLPKDFVAALKTVRVMAPHLPGGFISMVLPEMVGRHGLNHWEESLDALEWLTPFSSAEFALRPYLAKDLDKALGKAMAWAQHPNAHVRRLASEATRPRLPWAKKLHTLATSPDLALPILVALRADESRYVQKSVANHLNDFTKEKPEWVLDLLEGWPKDSENTLWIIQHATRNLIKAGHPRALALMGAKVGIAVTAQFSVDTREIALGQQMRLLASLASQADEAQKIVLDYAIHFARRNGKAHRKVFKWRTFALGAKETLGLTKGHLFVDLTTRKHTAGAHKIELLVNGQIAAAIDFRLTTP